MTDETSPYPDIENLPDEPAALVRLAADFIERMRPVFPGRPHFTQTLRQAADVIEHGPPEPDPRPPRGGHWAEEDGVWVSLYQGDLSGVTPHRTELDALRVAVVQDGRGDQVLFVRWGTSVHAADVARTTEMLAREDRERGRLAPEA